MIKNLPTNLEDAQDMGLIPGSGRYSGVGNSNPLPKKKKCKKAKWLSVEALQIAEKIREANSKGEKERYTLLNSEFQGIERIYKKKKPPYINNAKK